MKIRGNNVGDKAVRQSGSKGQVSSNKSASAKTSTAGSSDSSDKVSLTAAAKVEELIGQIDDLPIVDASRVDGIQQQLGTGSYEADEKHAAENLLEIEKNSLQRGNLDAHIYRTKTKLIELIQAELSMATSLQEILQREFDILSGDSPEQIETISKEKLTQMQLLTQQLAKRDQLLTILRLPPGKEGTDIMMQQLPQGHELLSHWEQLQKLSAKLQQQNTINGGIVAMGQRRAKQALDILRGKHGIPETYGPGGESRTDATPSSLAKA